MRFKEVRSPWIIAARSGSPLVVGKGIGENFIASDVLALKPVTDKFIYLEEGDLIELSSDDISIWNLEDESVIRSSVQVKLGPDSMDKGYVCTTAGGSVETSLVGMGQKKLHYIWKIQHYSES